MIIGKAVIHSGGRHESKERVPLDVNEATWEQISRLSIAGIGDIYWDVGDCKEITLNGTIGTVSFSNYQICIFILDFNHPINKTIPDNNIIWGGFKTALSNGKDIAICDAGYGDYTSPTCYDGTKYYNIEHWGAPCYGGWKSSDFRYDILGGTSTAPSGYGSAKTTSVVGYDATASTISSPVSNTFMSALPDDLRAVIRLWNRYVVNYSENDDDCSIATIDAVSLLSEYEVYGQRSSASSYEQNHQKQMEYYYDGNPKAKYKHNSTNTGASWWFASRQYDTSSWFTYCVKGGGNGYAYAAVPKGLAPAFRT